MASGIVITLLAFVAIPVLIVAMIYLIVPVFKGLGWLIRHLFQFVAGEISDVARAIGALITGIVLFPLILGNIVIGRWSASGHFGRALQSEFTTLTRSIYRLFIGHPARLLCLSPITEGIEKRIPEAIKAAPGADSPGRRAGQFDGYNIIGSLPGGGSGGKLYVAEPDDIRRAGFARRGVTAIDKVVIKSFSMRDGSSLPQIIRESQALNAARRLGLILDHHLSDDQFYYVMRYVPGDSLGLETSRLHAASGTGGLDHKSLASSLRYATDLLTTLRTYHDGGLWHKDVKPDNIIISGGRAHLVDFGLITPLRSGMTLTTHGTEYFRDPEMVRMALRGVKVHEVDGRRFDIYAAGAVLYSMIENSFPMHGGLSKISKSCPQALAWIIQRSMAEYHNRYEQSAQMLDDLLVVTSAPDPFKVKPADLPSMQQNSAESDDPDFVESEFVSPVPDLRPASPVPPSQVPDPAQVARAFAPSVEPGIPPYEHQVPPVDPVAPQQAVRPTIRLANWWTGRYHAVDAGAPAAPAPVVPVAVHPAGARAPRPRPVGVSAKQQLENARNRAREARGRAHARMKSHSIRAPRQPAPGWNAGVVAAVVLALLIGGGAIMSALLIPALSVGHVTITHNNEGAVVASTPANATQVVLQGRDDMNVLVLRERSSRDDAQAAAHATVQLSGMESAGFTLLGEMDDGDAESIDLAASLRAAIGTRPFESEGARTAIFIWLATQPNIDMVLWFDDAPESDGSHTAWLVVDAPEDDIRVQAARSGLAAVNNR